MVETPNPGFLYSEEVETRTRLIKGLPPADRSLYVEGPGSGNEMLEMRCANLDFSLFQTDLKTALRACLTFLPITAVPHRICLYILLAHFVAPGQHAVGIFYFEPPLRHNLSKHSREASTLAI